MKYYKVLSPMRRSANLSHDNIYSVEYAKRKFVEANPIMAAIGYHLLVFASVNAALIYTENNRMQIYNIWEVVCEDEISPLPLRMDTVVMEELLPDVVNIEDYQDIWRWPPGTRMFKRVKLVRCLTKEEVNDMAYGNSTKNLRR